MEHVTRPVLAGILTALVGFTSSFAVVLAGLRGVGASPAEAASGLLAVCATQALGVLWLVRRHRIPLTLAWSTPGAALLASTGVVHGGWPAPALTGASLLGLAIPLYVVTMAGQNIPGVAVMSSYGYQVPWRETMAVTGFGTAVGAMAGGHAINLAAITAAMAASPEAHP